MQHSDSIKELAVALHKAQGKFKSALKDSSNPHFRSKYADLTSVIDAVKPALNSEGIVFLQGLSSSENGVVVETMLLHVSGEWISEKLEIPASKHDAQGYGSACTYGRRYGLQAMCGVPAEDDDGNAASASAPPLSLALWPLFRRKSNRKPGTSPPILSSCGWPISNLRLTRLTTSRGIRTSSCSGFGTCSRPIPRSGTG